MRVLHLGKYFPPVAGGIERFLDELTLAQVGSGLQPQLLVHDRQPGRSVDRGRDILRCRSLGELVFVPLSPGWPQALSMLLRAAPPDLIHIHLPNPSAFWMLALARARRIPWIAHWHADIPRDSPHLGLRLGYPVYARFERALLARCQRIITTSSSYLDSSAALQAFRARCEVVPLGMAGAPAPLAAPAWPASSGLRLLAVGRLSHYKGFPLLLEALARVPGVQLLLIGEGEIGAELRARAAQADLRDRVRLLGRAEDGVIEAAYRGCDALCLPSINRAEAFGLVLLEAMRAGKPILASAVPGSGMSEVVQHEISGLQVPPGDLPSLVAALTRLRDAGEAQRQAWGAAGKQRFQTCYTITPVAAAIANIYRKVVADR